MNNQQTVYLFIFFNTYNSKDTRAGRRIADSSSSRQKKMISGSVASAGQLDFCQRVPFSDIYRLLCHFVNGIQNNYHFAPVHLQHSCIIISISSEWYCTNRMGIENVAMNVHSFVHLRYFAVRFLLTAG